jgi:hypothetical protein
MPAPVRTRSRPIELVENDLKKAKSEVADLQLELAEAHKRHAAICQELASERQALQRRGNQIAELEDDLRSQEGALARLRNATRPKPPTAPKPRLADALRTRGVLGLDEQALVLTGLVKAGKVGALADMLSPVCPDAFAVWLQEHTVLLGDCGSCPAAGVRTVLQVPRSRCEVCGGSDIKREARRFLDACLNHGATRITIVGGSPKYHRQLRELVQHRSIKLRLVPGDSRRSLRQARDDLRGSHLVIVWGGTLLDHATSAPYTQHSHLGHLITVHHRGITMMLRSVVDHLESGGHAHGQ